MRKLSEEPPPEVMGGGSGHGHGSKKEQNRSLFGFLKTKTLNPTNSVNLMLLEEFCETYANNITFTDLFPQHPFVALDSEMSSLL